MLASRPRNTHTAVAIKKARHTPVVNLPRATHPAHRRYQVTRIPQRILSFSGVLAEKFAFC